MTTLIVPVPFNRFYKLLQFHLSIFQSQKLQQNTTQGTIKSATNYFKKSYKLPFQQFTCIVVKSPISKLLTVMETSVEHVESKKSHRLNNNNNNCSLNSLRN